VALSVDQMELIRAALERKLGPREIGACSICSTRNWLLETSGLAILVLSDDPSVAQRGGKAIPAVVLSCTNCGNTVLLNIFNLGVPGALIKNESDAEESDHGLG